MDVRRESTVELTRSLRDRYWKARRPEKTAILNTFCEAGRPLGRVQPEVCDHTLAMGDDQRDEGPAEARTSTDL